MLKNRPLDTIGNKAKEKCGEIFCHSPTDFTIYCTFCNMKAFSFEDFQLHVQNVHFENNLLKTTETINNECFQYLEVNIKNEFSADGMDQLHEEEEMNYNSEQSFDDASDDGINDSKEEILSVLKKSKETVRVRRKNTPKRKGGNKSNDEDNDHSSDEDFKVMLNEKPTSTGTEDILHPCEKCGKTFKNRGLLKSHMSRVHGEISPNKTIKKEKVDKEPLLCPECNLLFSNIKDLDQHVNEMHEGYKCSLCDKRFKERGYVKRHELYHTAGRMFQCNFEGCDKSYVIKRDLDRHLDTHVTERNFECTFETCSKSFLTLRRLKQHIKTHTKPKHLVCDTCGYTCRENAMLKIHQRSHTGEKPYACEVCEKRFISSSALSEHMALHTNIRSHVCKVCNASFSRPKSLYHHSFIHSDVKKFKCKLCGTAYKQAAGLAGHMRKHRDEGMVTDGNDKPPVFSESFPFLV